MTLRFRGAADRAGLLHLLVLIVAAALVAGCGSEAASKPPAASGQPSTSSAGPPGPAPGGTLRIAVPKGSFTEELADPKPTSLDPQLAGWFGYELLRCCLVRSLYSHRSLYSDGSGPAEGGGSRLYPDLAAALPEVSADGLTWRVRIKAGLHYGPPLQEVEITSHDFVRSFKRTLAPSISAAEVEGWWYLLFLEIEGATEYNLGKAASITGLEAPDDHTLVFRLVRPVGDFGARLATWAAGPLPPDPLHPDAAFGIAEGADAGYGRFLVSSGPYMVEGSEQLDFSVPADRRAPAAGLAEGRLTLVRNPSWDRASDELRPAYADRIEIRPAASVKQAVAAIDAGTADLVWPSGEKLPTLPVDVYDAFQADPTRGTVHLNDIGMVRYALLNVAVPPFDDPHVRKALNFAIDKQDLVDRLGGSVAAAVMGHGVPDNLEDDLLVDYDPYTTQGHRGDLDAARAEIALSKYDSDRDGRCDAPACEHVRALTRDTYPELGEAVAGDLAPLGIHLDVDVVGYQTLFYQPPEERIPLLIGVGLTSNYIGGAGVLELANESHHAFAGGGYNWTMVGATPEQLRGWGYEVTDVPNVDDRVEACVPLVGAAQFECIAQVDMYLMEHVMAMVPLTQDRYAALVSPRVLRYGVSVYGTTALDQIALQP